MFKIHLLEYEHFVDKLYTKNTWWFRFPNDFFDKPYVCGLQMQDQILYLLILSAANQISKPHFVLDPEFVAQKIKMRQQALKKSLDALAVRGIIKYDLIEEIPDRTEEKRREENRREQNRTICQLVGSTPTGNLFSLWNSKVKDVLPQVRLEAVPPDRLAAAKKAVAQFPSMDYWCAVFERATKNSFLRGEKENRDVKTAWRANIDWILKSKNHRAVFEGVYPDDSADSHVDRLRKWAEKETTMHKFEFVHGIEKLIAAFPQSQKIYTDEVINEMFRRLRGYSIEIWNSAVGQLIAEAKFVPKAIEMVAACQSALSRMPKHQLAAIPKPVECQICDDHGIRLKENFQPNVRLRDQYVCGCKAGLVRKNSPTYKPIDDEMEKLLIGCLFKKDRRFTKALMSCVDAYNRANPGGGIVDMSKWGNEGGNGQSGGSNGLGGADMPKWDGF